MHMIAPARARLCQHSVPWMASHACASPTPSTETLVAVISTGMAVHILFGVADLELSSSELSPPALK